MPPSRASRNNLCPSRSSLGALGVPRKRGEGFGKVGADLGTQLRAQGVGPRSADLHPIDDPDAVTFEAVDSVNGSHDHVREFGLIDEQVGVDRFGDA